MTNYLIVPGLGNSGEDHWQTYFENSGNNFQRIIQKEWDSPNCLDWIRTINDAISGYDPRTVVLIGHSLGCATIAHWAAHFKSRIKGALLVAPSDLDAPQYTFPATGFNPVPMIEINFKTILVASSNDPWVTTDRAKLFANTWASEYVNIGNAGHINISSGFGPWEQGLKILKTLG